MPEEIAQLTSKKHGARHYIGGVVDILTRIARVTRQAQEVRRIQDCLEHRQIIQQIIEIGSQAEKLGSDNQDDGPRAKARLDACRQDSIVQIEVPAWHSKIEGGPARGAGVETACAEVLPSRGIAQNQNAGVGWRMNL